MSKRKGTEMGRHIAMLRDRARIWIKEGGRGNKKRKAVIQDKRDSA